jgi:3-oxoacyl-[acyl-carrier protein] reductase
MDLGLSDKTALVLGGSRGLGAAIAQALLREGATVYAAARNVESIAAWTQTVPPDERPRLRPIQTDLSKRESVVTLAQTVLSKGPIDILVNNGGGPPPGAASTVSPDLWIEQFKPMAAHIFELTQLLLPGMIERRWGRIINVASSGVEQPIANLALSNAIRSAVVGWSKTLAAEVGQHGVTVNVVVPGRIHTSRVDELDGAAAQARGISQAEVAKLSTATIPVGRYGTTQEFADVVTFLASVRASYITGARIRVDGGMIRSI